MLPAARESEPHRSEPHHGAAVEARVLPAVRESKPAEVTRAIKQLVEARASPAVRESVLQVLLPGFAFRGRVLCEAK